MNAFADALRLLEGERVEGTAAARILEDFGLWDGGEQARALLALAARASRVFELISPLAPGLCFIGATLDPRTFGVTGEPPIDVAGRGVDRGEAFASCMGEAAERLCALEWGNEAMTSSPPDAREAELFELEDAACDWLPARDLTNDRDARVPADQVFLARRGRGGAGSAGCAAGVSLEDATRRALLELIERDAAALWWEGGVRPRPLAPEAFASAMETVSLLRRGRRQRSSRLFDITTDLGVPVCAAISHEHDGHGLACGLAAAATLDAAARTAALELCQMELALVLARLKADKNDGEALTDADRRHLRLAREVDAKTCPLLSPAQGPASRPFLEAGLPALLRRLAASEIDVFAVVLTRERIGVPVARALTPSLQGLAAGRRTPRLSMAIAKTGCGRPYTNGANLL